MYRCLANKGCILLLFERREFTKSFNNLTGGEVKLLCICEFPIYDHPVVNCPPPSPHPAPIATSLLAYEWDQSGLQFLLKIFSDYEALFCYQKPLEPDWSSSLSSCLLSPEAWRECDGAEFLWPPCSYRHHKIYTLHSETDKFL